ncbi:MAG: tetratricopeptide repeat protein, partial [Legionella sp.]|nr:tetratricopeptide repeat protein [Legionella sp.]
MMAQGLALAENTTSSVFQNMQRLRSSNDLNEAHQLGQVHLKSHPKDADVLLLIGLIYYQEKKFPEARHYLNLALILSPDYLDAQLGLIRLALAQKDDVEAIRLIEKAEQKSPRNIRLQTLKQQLQAMRPQATFTKPSYLKMTNPLPEMQQLRKKGEVNLAVTLGEHYLSVYPKDADILLLMGLIAYQKKNFPEARLYLNQALTHSPDYLDAQLGLIRLALAQKNDVEAEQLIKKAEQQSPRDIRLQTLKQQLQAMQSQAVLPKSSYLTPIASLKPKIANPLPEIKRLREKGEVARAIALGKHYLKIYSKDADVLLFLGLLYYQKQDFDVATTYFNHVLVIAPHYVDATLGLIRIAIAEKKYKEAAHLLHNLKQKNPHDLRIKTMFTELKQALYQHQLMLVNKAIQQKNYSRAETLAQKMLLQNPSDQEVRLILGKIYIYQKKYQYGIREFSEILTHNPWSKKTRVALISAELTRGDDRKALSLVSESLALSP